MNSAGALQRILNRLPIATVLFDSKATLQAYNLAVRDLWNLDHNVLDFEPNIIELFEILRENAIYPEKDNFREFCNTIYNYTVNTSPYNNKNILLLADGSYIEETFTKSNDGMLITWEDISKKKKDMLDLNNYHNIYNRFIKYNPLPMLVVNSNGLVENYNAKLIENFNLNIEELDRAHITELNALWEYLINSSTDTNTILNNILENRTFSITIDKICISGIGLPNRKTLVFFEDNTYSNSAIISASYANNISKLYDRIITDINTLVKNPLDDITSLANLMHEQYSGVINIRQRSYLEKIIHNSQSIIQEIQNKVALLALPEQTVEIKALDLHDIIATILNLGKQRITNKNIKVTLNMENGQSTIQSDYTLLQQALTLLLLYLLEQNNFAAEIILTLKQNKEGHTLIFQDNAKEAIFSELDKQNRYDVKLILSIINKLNISYTTAYKKKSYREIILNFPN